MADPLKPDVTLLIKLGSIIVHTEELWSPGGHEFDKIAAETLLKDPEIRDWIEAMGAFLPLKRS